MRCRVGIQSLPEYELVSFCQATNVRHRINGGMEYFQIGSATTQSGSVLMFHATGFVIGLLLRLLTSPMRYLAEFFTSVVSVNC
ncbi:hypothetical protein L211DRAFT_650958 [Terfezia boudieri ATCC MYA-4762]|uniref:Uncharacterized protein n=1 Tax=Terfezia boudieri ATCC MYA-4762 TaxID=1051890 RepID=A0A3N4LV26_9PEZI|nr:hypothetical protein L211DRAFT_650958 [Terfezia boudieri ATCC MYA-4762]